jgi:uncharacterized protein (TIGR02996 family)
MASNYEAAFLAHVLANPDDDTPRLVYADWLDEQGQDARAEFIRVQCALALVLPCVAEFYGCQPCRKLWPAPHEGKGNGPHCATCRDFVRLHQREQALWGSIAVGRIPQNLCEWSAGAWKWAEAVHYRRGFVEGVVCRGDAWARHGDALLTRHPVREVSLTRLPDCQVSSGPFPDGRCIANLTECPRVVGGVPHNSYLAAKMLLAQGWPAVTFHLPEPAGVPEYWVNGIGLQPGQVLTLPSGVTVTAPP